MLMYAHHVAVKSIPGPDAADLRVRPNAVRRLCMTSARHFMVAAIDLMRRFRPLLP